MEEQRDHAKAGTRRLLVRWRLVRLSHWRLLHRRVNGSKHRHCYGRHGDKDGAFRGRIESGGTRDAGINL